MIKREHIKALESVIKRDHENITGMIIQQDGQMVYEGYADGYQANSAVHVASVTKSVFSILIGIAIDKGYLQSIDQRVLDFFPDYKVLPGEETIQKITIRHLLTMTAPYKYETEPYEKFFTCENPVDAALDLLGGHKPIGVFHYAAIGGPQILSGILTNVTKQHILDFANQHLFLPLGINVPKDITLRSQAEHIAVMNDKLTRGWVADPQGINTASWGLFLTPSDMMKIGQLYLDGGLWQGDQLVSASWIDESTREQSRCTQWGDIGYGYLWWLIDENSFAAMGDGGNVIYVNVKSKSVIAITASFMPNAQDRIALIKKVIEPMLDVIE
ncbi:serine hydrolase [Fusibacter paucivorans]|uniref:Serine hydrolase n=1 Tax=Fusibacter paucivorans TaxID=76009 RepID=A0ABS5PKL2_9FIRM|nr:serine hydrolase [Fusibacter paucivorans]MBS7525674.1 serine hydrolase [Fusibacter paucivorans]